jgi:ATP-binding protein involved in chromosome partitioning
MKIAVFAREGRVSPQCQESPHVAIVDVDQQSNSVQQITALTPPPHLSGALAGWLHQQEVKVVLTGGLRQRDRDLLEDKGIRVIAGVPSFRIEPVIASFLAGTLQTGTNSCEQQTGTGA